MADLVEKIELECILQRAKIAGLQHRCNQYQSESDVDRYKRSAVELEVAKAELDVMNRYAELYKTGELSVA